MQQEDRFFYEDRNRDSTSIANEPHTGYPNNPFTEASNPTPEHGSSKMILNSGSRTSLQNPFEDLSRQNTLTDESFEYGKSETSKMLRRLSDDEEKQEENDERDINVNNYPNSLNTTIADTPNIQVDYSKRLAEDDDSDREFDWNDDPDQVKPKRRKTARERFTAVMKNPCCWHYLSPVLKRIIIAILGSCVFIVIAVVIFMTMPAPTEAQLQDPNFTNVRSNVQCWMYWSAFMWHIFWLTTFLLDMVPAFVSLWTKLFHGRRSEKVKSYMEVT